jgi:hypothetical protein
VPSPILPWGACPSIVVAGRVDKLPISQPFVSRLNAPRHSQQPMSYVRRVTAIAATTTPAALAAKAATRNIPIAFEIAPTRFSSVHGQL